MSNTLVLIDPADQEKREFSWLNVCRVHIEADIRMAPKGKFTIWIVPNKPAEKLLLRSLEHHHIYKDVRLLSLKQSESSVSSLLRAHFRTVLSLEDEVHWLPVTEILEALGSDNRASLFIGGVVVPSSSFALFYRGNLETISVPLKWFKRGHGAIAPDFKKLEIIDNGLTVQFGDYEASVDAILYEFDNRYRKEAKKRSVKQDTSIGGAIKRLRLQMRLRQSDFEGITAKEIARIESGKVRKPHQETLKAIAKRAGVTVDQISSF